MIRFTGKILKADGFARMLRDEIPKNIRKELRKQVRAEAQLLLRRMMVEIHSITGKTLAQFKIRISAAGLNARIGIFGNRAHIGRFVNDGTQGHLIEPKNKKILKIGQTFITGGVRHPGNAAQNWRVKENDPERVTFQNNLRNGITEALKGLHQ